MDTDRNNFVGDYETQIESLKAKRNESAARLEALRTELAEIKDRGDSMDSIEAAGIRNEIHALTDSIVDNDTRARRLNVILALRKFDRFATELTEIANGLGGHSAGIASLAGRGQTVAGNLNEFIAELFPEGSLFRSGWETREKNLFNITGAPAEEDPLCVLQEMANIGGFVRSRMDALRIALETELKIRR